MKDDMGRRYPSHAYAYTPTDDPRTWEFRVKNYIRGKLTLDLPQVKKATDTFQGKKLAERKAALIKANLRGCYTRLGEEPPAVLGGGRVHDPVNQEKEFMGAFVQQYMQLLTERAPAGKDVTVLIENLNFQTDDLILERDAKGALKVIRNVVFLGSTSLNQRRYLERAMEQAVPLYEGAKLYLNHSFFPTGRPIQELWGRAKNVRYDREARKIKGDAVVIDHEDRIEKYVERASDLVGFSHTIKAQMSDPDDNGWVDVEEIQKVYSVDLVTDPATTKGIFETNKRKEEERMNLEELRSKYPELVSAIANEAIEAAGDAASLDALSKKVEALEEANRKKDATIKTMEDAQKAVTTTKTLEILLAASNLPDASKDRLRKAIEGQVIPEDKLKEAIKAEEDYIVKLKGDTVTGVDETQTGTGEGKTMESVSNLIFGWAGAQKESKEENTAKA